VTPRGGPDVQVLPAGEDALLLEVDGLDEVLAVDAVLRPLLAAGEGVWARVTDVVPAARTVLVVTAGPTDLEALADAVLGAVAGAVTDVGGSDLGSSPQTASVEVPVTYDGPDLEDVARHTGLAVDEVVAAHTGRSWRVAFGGFAPGFAYLVGGDERLHVPRLESPRSSVPAGAVGLAGEFSGVYPRSSPGGWRLLGTTDLVLWDAERDPPALLRPGTVVRFVDARGRS
jgi:KipI family sensor histidine kinase inhibitor